MTSTSTSPLPIQNPLQEYHLRLSQHVHAILQSSKAPVTTPTAPSLRTNTSSGSSSHRQDRLQPERATSSGSSSISPVNSSINEATETSPEVIEDNDLTARPEKQVEDLYGLTPSLHQIQAHDKPPALVHHRHNPSSSRSGATDHLASPIDPSPPHAAAHADAVDAEGLTRDQEHKKAWQSDGSRVYHTIPSNFTLSMDSIGTKKSRTSSGESKEGNKLLQDLRSTEAQSNSERRGEQVAQEQPVPQLDGSRAKQANVTFGEDDGVGPNTSALSLDKDDLALKMGLVITPPVGPRDPSSPVGQHPALATRTFKSSKIRVNPAPSPPENALLNLSPPIVVETPLHSLTPMFGISGESNNLPRVRQESAPNPSTSNVAGKVTSAGHSSHASSAAGPSVHSMTSKPSVNGQKLPMTAKSGKTSGKSQEPVLRDALVDDAEEETEAKREIRSQRRQADLRKRVGQWATGIDLGNFFPPPEIDPTPPSPSVATSHLRHSPFIPLGPPGSTHSPLSTAAALVGPVHNPFIPSPSSRVYSAKPAIVSFNGSGSKSSTSKTETSLSKLPGVADEVHNKASSRSLRPRSSKPKLESSGAVKAPLKLELDKPSLKGSMFSFSTGLDTDYAGRMRALDALLGDMSLRGAKGSAALAPEIEIAPTTKPKMGEPRKGGYAQHPFLEKWDDSLHPRASDGDDTPRKRSVAVDGGRGGKGGSEDGGERMREGNGVRLTKEFKASHIGRESKRRTVEIREGMPTPKAKIESSRLSYVD